MSKYLAGWWWAKQMIPYDSVSYVLAGSPEAAGYTSRDGFVKYLGGYGYQVADSVRTAASDYCRNDAGIRFCSLLQAAMPAAQLYTYRSIQNKVVRKADGIIETCKSAVNICIGLIGIMALFMGFMSIAERAGGIRLLSRIIGPFFSRLFPDIPKGHPAMGHMMMNFSANLLGLDNAATPFGIKAMESLQELNPE